MWYQTTLHTVSERHSPRSVTGCDAGSRRRRYKSGLDGAGRQWVSRCAAMWRRLLLLLALLVVAASAAPPARRAGAPRKSKMTRRYCSCHDKGNRHNRTYQTCVMPEDGGEGVVCTSETLPYISRWHRHFPAVGRLMRAYYHKREFNVAQSFCEEENARLLVPQNKAALADAYTHIKTTNMTDTMLGVSDLKSECRFVDTDGISVRYLPWGPKRPDNFHDEDCVIVIGPNRIEDRPCYYDYKSFICERRMIPVKGYEYIWRHQGYFKFYKEKKSHANARKTCERDRGRLAVIENWEQVSYLAFMMESFCWVDFTDEEVEGQFVTSEGKLMEDLDFSNWAPDEPDNGVKYGKQQNCVGMMTDAYYYDYGCDRQFSFLCEIKRF